MKYLGPLCVGILILLGVLATTKVGRHTNEYAARCREQGGEPIRSHSGSVCISKNQLIQVR